MHIVCLNIERSRHLDRVIPFLAREAPAVACLQEVVADDLPRLQSDAGLDYGHFVAMATHPADSRVFGIAILSRTPFAATDALVYAGGGDGRTLFDRATPESKIATCRYAVALATVDLAGRPLHIATTHFPWTPDGGTLPFQRVAAEAVISGLRATPLVLTGDFNAPRGGPIFARFAATWRDCIPPHVTTSLDPVLHRAGPLELMVDGLFTTADYVAANVALHRGVSDHQAITADINHAA